MYRGGALTCQTEVRVDTKTIIPKGIQQGYMARKNIKVSEETFERLDAAKRDGVTWDVFFEDLLLHAMARQPSGADAPPKDDFSDWNPPEDEDE